ncbi:MAG: molybdenum ABC transporter ATP-binding protein [Paracoccaceae bacterium]
MTDVLAVKVRLRFGTFALDVEQDIPLVGITALFGPSGSGKSTLLRVIAGLETGAEGRVVMAGEVWQSGAFRLPPERRGVGYVFQDARLFSHLNVQGNLAFAAKRARGLGGPGMVEVVAALDLEGLLSRPTSDLSGGERQRVAMGRALLSAPRILLLDEPLAALDETRKAEILPYLERLSAVSGVPMLYVSHSMAEVARLSQHMIIMRGGRVVRSGPTDAVLADPQAVTALGPREMGAVISARVAAQEADGLTRLETAAGPLFLPRLEAAIGAVLRVRIHAQDVILATARPENISALNVLPAVVTEVLLGDGPGAMVQVRAGNELILARITRRSAEALALAPGMACFAILKSVAVARADVGGAV